MSPRSLSLLIIIALATSASAQTTEYLIEGRDRRHGTFNGQLLIKQDASGLRAIRTTHYLERGSETMEGPATRNPAELMASFPVHSGMVGRITGPRFSRPIDFTITYYSDTDDIDTRCKQGSALRSTGTGIIVVGHPKNNLPANFRRPALVKRTHKYTRFPGTPFIKGQDDKHEVATNDVGQGALGDCYFMAGLAAVAHTDPHRIRSMIRQEADGSFSVTVFRHNDQWEETVTDASGFYTPTVKATRIVVDNLFPSGPQGGRPVYAWFGDETTIAGQTIKELWPMILEKAWAQHRGSYGAIEGGWASTPMSFFSAKVVWDGNPREISNSDLLGRFKYADRMNFPVTLGVPSPGGDHDLNVHDDHYYTFVGMDGDRVRLYNPWGTDHPVRSLTIAEVKRIFDGMHVGRF